VTDLIDRDALLLALGHLQGHDFPHNDTVLWDRLDVVNIIKAFTPEAADPVPEGSVREGAVMLHELYLNYVEAGFTKTQAFTLITEAIRPARS
jgi:hypothetical protein